MKKTLLCLLLAFCVIMLPGCRNKPGNTISNSQTIRIEQPASSSPAKKFETAPGAVGYIDFAGTAISGSVMQASDNDYYLRRDEYRQSSEWGCYYMDYECSTAPPSPNLVIYGHSFEDSADNERFSQLKKLNSPEFAKHNNTITLMLGSDVYTFKVFSAGYASALTDTVAITAAPTQSEMENIISLALDRSIVDFNVEVSASDTLLTLSTCTSDADIRYLVTAVLQEG